MSLEIYENSNKYWKEINKDNSIPENAKKINKENPN